MKQEKLTDEKIKEYTVSIHQLTLDNKNSVVDIWYGNADIGEKLYLIKNNLNGSTKEFGEYLQINCPLLNVKLVSYYIKLSGHNDDNYDATTIIKWLRANDVQAVNPRSCWDKFNAAHKTPPEADETNGPVEKPLEKPADNKLIDRLENLLTELKKAELSDVDKARLQNLSDQFSDIVDEIA